MQKTKDPPAFGRGESLEKSFDGDSRETTKNPDSVQAGSRPSTAVFELMCETQIDEILGLCSELASHAEIACGYASIRNERGLNYAINCIVQLAIRAGDENLMLRRKRAEARAAETERQRERRHEPRTLAEPAQMPDARISARRPNLPAFHWIFRRWARGRSFLVRTPRWKPARGACPRRRDLGFALLATRCRH
jgi:hypothetical protein